MNTEKLYPELKDNIWGGRKLIEKYGKTTKNAICAESWELSFHPDGPTKLSDGSRLCDVANEELLGANTKNFEFFPLMIKLIDAKDNLSVQVHPDDTYALKYENSFGKTEMWYIVEADEGAGIYLGFKEDVSEEQVENAIKQNTLTSLMNFFEVKAGDCYFIPSGTIHAIGTGCLIYEIQQNSNLTYRVYDYDRRDKNGNPRELHVEKALKVLDFSKYEPTARDGELLGISKYFTAKKVILKDEARAFMEDEASFRCVTVTKGAGYINNIPICLGDSYFIPAGSAFSLSGEMTAIIAEVRKYGVKAELSDSCYTVTLFDDLGNSICCATENTEEKAKQKLYKLMNISENDLTL